MEKKENGKKENGKKENGKKKLLIVLSVAGVCILLIGLAVFLIIPEQKARMKEKQDQEDYADALEKLEEGEIDEAKELFEELGNYEDSEDYVQQLTSKITGVSDASYYKAMQLIQLYSSEQFKTELGENLCRINETEGFYPCENINHDLSFSVVDAIEDDDYIKGIYADIESIDCGETYDGAMKELYKQYMNVLIDYLWSVDVEQDTGDFHECSNGFMFNVMVIILAEGEDADLDSIESMAVLSDSIERFEMDIVTITEVEDAQWIKDVEFATMFHDLLTEAGN